MTKPKTIWPFFLFCAWVVSSVYFYQVGFLFGQAAGLNEARIQTYGPSR